MATLCRIAEVLLTGCKKIWKTNKDIREFQMGLSKLGKDIEMEDTCRKRQDVDVFYCNYIGFKTGKNFLVFKVKM